MPWKKVSTMEERIRFVVLAEAGKQCLAELCRQFGISRTCGYKWLQRKKELGLRKGNGEREKGERKGKRGQYAKVKY
jgi:transposase-like protein